MSVAAAFSPAAERGFDHLEAQARALPEMTFATSRRFRMELHDLVANAPDAGDVVEIGAFRGGSTVFLADACARSGRSLHVVDLSSDFLAIARANVSEVRPDAHVHYFNGTAEAFFERFSVDPFFLVFIDADHRYDAVRADIDAVKTARKPPRWWLFHDYSLRGTARDRWTIRVDRAIRDAFVLGSDSADATPLRRFGDQFRDPTPMNSGGDCWMRNGTEGVLASTEDLERAGAALDRQPATPPPTLPGWDAFLGMAPEAIDAAVDAVADGLGAPRDEDAVRARFGEPFCAFLKRWHGSTSPRYAEVSALLGRPELWRVYVADAVARIAETPFGDAILSTTADYDAGHALNDPTLNMMGLAAIRSAFVNERIAERRRQAVGQVLSSGALSPSTAAQLREFADNLAAFEEQGYVLLPNIGDAATLGSLRGQLSDETVMVERNCTKIDGDTPLYRMGLNSKDHPAAMAIVRSPRFLPLYSAICGTRIGPIGVFTEFIHQGGRVGADADQNKLWHVDTFHSTFKWWCFFEGAERRQGPFQYYRGSHRNSPERLQWLTLKSVYASLDRGRGSVSQSHQVGEADTRFLKLGEPETFDVAANSLMIVDTGGVHRRSEAEQGVIRRSFFGWARHELV